MDALQKAREALESAEDVGTYGAMAEFATLASAYAAIAQAEQLKRIADALEPIIREWSKPRYTINNANIPE